MNSAWNPLLPSTWRESNLSSTYTCTARGITIIRPTFRTDIQRWYLGVKRNGFFPDAVRQHLVRKLQQQSSRTWQIWKPVISKIHHETERALSNLANLLLIIAASSLLGFRGNFIFNAIFQSWLSTRARIICTMKYRGLYSFGMSSSSMSCWDA